MEKSNITKDQYFEIDKKSYSKLKDYDTHPYIYKLKHVDKRVKEKKDRSLDLGSVFDCLLLTPDEFDKTYYVFDEHLSPAIVLIAEDIKKRILEEDLRLINADEIILTIKRLKLYNNITKRETLIAKIENERILNLITKYLSIPKDLIVINKELYEQAVELVNKVCTDLLLGQFFDEKYLAELQVETFHQFLIEFEYRDMEFKSLIDKLVIDHKEKTISGIDIKTISDNTTKFQSSYFKYRYDIQAFLYQKAITYLRDLYYPNYKVLSFSFLVVSTTLDFIPPAMIVINEHQLQKAQDGYMYLQRYYMGVDELIDSIKWSEETNIWDYNKITFENKGINVLTY